jgi:integrase
MKLREKKSGKKTRYYYQITVTKDGVRKQREFPMGDDKKLAKSKAARFKLTCEDSGVEAAIEELNGGKPLKKGDSPTVDQLEKLYREFQKVTSKPIRESTVYCNVMALRRIFKAVNATNLNQVNPSNLRKIMLGESPEDRKVRSFAATIMHAKSIFKPACLRFYETEGVKLKNIFEAVELNAPQIKPYTPLNKKVINGALENLNTLPACEQIIFLLCYYYGLRRIEAEHCRMDWFSDNGKKVYITIESNEHFRTKTNEARVLPVARDIYERIVKLRNTLNPKDNFTAYVDSKTPTARLDRRFKNLNAYLKKHGFTQKRAVQQLRKECGSRTVSETKSIFEAQRVLGHSSPTVTAKHYANLLNISTVGETVIENSIQQKMADFMGITVEELKTRLGL